MRGGYRLAIDFGTATTVAVLLDVQGPARPLLFGASPLLASAVYAGAGGDLLTGGDAEHAAVSNPARFEANPKRCVDDGVVWLADREVPVVDLVAAVLGRVRVQAQRIVGASLESVVLTHPATWRASRLAVLTSAAQRVGFDRIELVAEPVAAAAYFVNVLGQAVSPGLNLVVYDLGAGTFDVSIVRQLEDGAEVVSSDGLADVGGLDLDAAVVSYARELTVESEDAWSRLDLPTTTADQQARQALWRGARAAKELLSRHATAELYLPVVDRSLHLTRTEFERLAKPYLDRTVAATVTALQIAGVPRQDVAGVFLVGGSSQIPLAATLLHRALKIAPTTIDDPQLVVAEGSLRYRAQPVAASKPTPALSPTAALPSDWDPPSSSWPGFTYRLTYPTGAIGRLRRRRAQVTVTAHQSCLGVDLAVAVSAGPIMPLRVEDGDAVHRFSDLTFAAGQPQSFAVPIHESFERPFWVRCFVESPADAVVDDPAVSEMRLM